jgi:hypothetical protein
VHHLRPPIEVSCEKNAVDGNFRRPEMRKGNEEVEDRQGRGITINDFKMLQIEKRTMGKLIQLKGLIVHLFPLRSHCPASEFHVRSEILR